jgi:hypothetical protein
MNVPRHRSRTDQEPLDLKSLAHELMREAQQELQAEDHLTPTAIVITPRENLIFDIEYESDEEREEIYSELVEVARGQNALAIITVNDIYLDDDPSVITLEGAGWGPLQSTAREAVMITISGSGFETWSLLAPYSRSGPQLIFQPVEEQRDPGAEVELLGDWTNKTGAA